MRSVDVALESPASAPVAVNAGTATVVPLVRLYLACVATWGACIPLWVYRTARSLDPAPDHKRKHLAWAAGSLMPWVACLLAYELVRLAQAGMPPQQTAGARRPAIAFGVAAMLVLALFGTALSSLHSLKLLLLPIPVLLCQAAVNRNARASSMPWELAGGTRIALNVLAALSLPAALLLGTLDGDTWGRLTAETYAQGGKVRGTSGRYELTLAGEWRRVPPGTFGDADTELELERVDQRGTNWIVAYVEPEGTLDLDARVAARRAVIEDSEMRLTTVQEKRYFVDQETFAVASVTRYDAVIARVPTRFWVLATIWHGFAIELVAHSDAPARDEPTMQKMLKDVVFIDRKDAP